VDAFALLYFVKIWGLLVRRIGVCGYGYIHGYPRKICGYGYGYGWEISYPRQAWLMLIERATQVVLAFRLK